MAKRRRRPRSTPKKNNKPLFLSLIAIIVVLFIAFLLALTRYSPKSVAVTHPVATSTKTKERSQLPSRVEEVWSYIKDLETREIPIDDKALDSTVHLTPEQKKILLAMAQENASRESTLKNTQTKNTSSPVLEVASTPLVVPTAKPKDSSTSTPTQTKVTIEEATMVSMTPTSQPNNPKFGLQCGAFKNKAQAEALSVRIIMNGLNAKIASSNSWHRVMVGPIGDKKASQDALENIKHIAHCIMVSM